jgi:hypothetical protein
MGVETQRYIRKPLYVQAVRVTPENFDELVKWCQGEVETKINSTRKNKKYIKVRVHHPKNPRQTQAFVGDWILYTDRGYKVYTNDAFNLAFDLVDEVVKVKEYPYEEGDVVVLGPEIFAAKDGGVISWKGENFVPQAVPEPEVVEETDAAHAVQSLPPVEEAVDVHTTPQGEPHEYVEATPQAIFDTVKEQQPVELNEEDAADKIEQAGQPEPVSEGAGPGGNEFDGSSSIPAIVPPEVAPQPEPVSEQPPEIAAAGKMVISIEEQQQLGPEGVRELLASGEAILAQDLAESA